jgi:hypothetical protein
VTGDQQYFDPGIHLFDLPEGFDPVHPRHPDVQNRHIHFLARYHLHRLLSVGCGQDPVTVTLIKLFQQRSNGRFVIGYQNGRLRIHVCFFPPHFVFLVLMWQAMFNLCNEGANLAQYPQFPPGKGIHGKGNDTRQSERPLIT